MAKPVEFDGHPYKMDNNPPTYAFACRKVMDGDTFEGWVDFGLRNYDWREIRVRDFDAPEIFHPRNEAELQHGLAAKLFAVPLLSLPLIVTTHRNITTYGRFEAEVSYWQDKKWNDFATAMKVAEFEKRASY